MDADLYRRAQSIFDALIEAPPTEQSALLRIACGPDRALADLVARLLAADARTSDVDARTGLGVATILAREVANSVPPDHLGAFRVVRELGRGGMGVVYEAEQDVPRRRVALKTLPWWRGSDEAVTLFHREIQAMAQIIHPGIPQVFEVFEIGRLPVLAMELVEGRRLDEAAQLLSLRQRVALIEQIADALQAAHDAGVIHRDLKPSNVLVTPDGRAKVLDFGIAALAIDEVLVAGTTAYAAPEQLAGGVADVRSDVYGLGALAWEVVTGGPPLDLRGLTLPEILEAKASPQQPPTATPRPLAAVIARALAADPAARYPSARAFAADLRRYLQHRPVEALAGDLRHAVSAHARRLAPAFGLAIVGAALAVALVLVVAVWLRARESAAVEARAAAQLAALQEIECGGAASCEELERAFDAFVRDPAQDGTRALPAAWRWRAERLEGAARRRALSNAWTTAQNPEDAWAALAALAPQLAAERRWTALTGLLARLPADRGAAERTALALARRDIDAAAAISAEVEPLRELFAAAQPAPRAEMGVVLPGGELLLVGPERLARVRGDGSPVRAWPLPGHNVLLAVEGRHAWFTNHVEGTPRKIYRLDSDRDEAPRFIEAFDSAVMAVALGDLDRDGVLERYTGIGPYANSLRVAEPPEAPSRALHLPTEIMHAEQHALVVADLERDGAPELVAGSFGWENYGLQVLAAAPDAPRVVGRLRVGTRKLVVLADPTGAPTIVSGGRPFGTLPLTPGPDLLVRSHLSPAGLVVRTAQELPRVFDLRAVDLDGDGMQDLAASSEVGLHLFLQAGDGSLAEHLVADLRLIDVGELDGDPGAELWVRDELGGWFLGTGSSPLPTRAFEPLTAAADPPAIVEGLTRRTWERAEALVSVGLAADAADAFAVLGDRPGPAGAAALTRAIELLAGEDRRGAADLARRLVARRGLAPEQLRIAVDALTAVHAFSELEALRADLPSRTQALLDRLGERAAPIDRGRVHASLAIRAPELVRLGAHEPGLELLALAGQGELAALPLRWDGEVLDLEFDLEVLELDWGGRFEVSLARGPWRFGVELARGGGGPPAGHHISVGCFIGQERKIAGMPFRTGPHRLRLSWVGSRGELRCLLDDLAVTRTGAGAPAGDFVLGLSAPVVGVDDLPLARVRIRDLAIAGAALVGQPADATPRRFSLGDPEATRRYLSRGTPLQRALAAAALAEAVDLAGLGERERSALLRLDATRWSGPLAEALGAGFIGAWMPAWNIPIHFRDDSAEAALLHPVLEHLDLADPASARVALVRAELLLDRGHRTAALLLLGRLCELPELSERAWLLVARARVRGGDEAGAALAVEAALRSARAPEQSVDRIADDGELRALLPVGLAPGLALRGATP